MSFPWPPTVSVIILNWNGAKVLPACLESVYAATPAPDEVIVVDNHSEDGSTVWLHQHEHPLLKKIFLDHNSGYAAGNNRGIVSAKGDIVVLLNNDTVVDPQFLAAAIPHFREQYVAMVACKTLRLEEPGVLDKAGHLIFPDGMNRGRGTGLPDDGRFDTAGEALWPDGSGAFYRKYVLEQVGLLDEDFFLYGEDSELGLRIRWSGYECKYEPRAVIHHHHSAGLGKFAAKKIYYIERNRLWMLFKSMPLSMVFLSPLWTVWRYLWNFISLISGKGAAAGAGQSTPATALVWAVLRAWWDGLLGAPRMFRKRLNYQKLISGKEMRGILKKHRISARALTLED